MSNDLEKKTKFLLSQNQRISPAFLMRNLKVNNEQAKKLMYGALNHQCHKWFLIRNLQMEENEAEDYINSIL